MEKKIVVLALGHRALGKSLPEQKLATREAAKAVADLVESGAEVVITHSNSDQVGMKTIRKSRERSIRWTSA